MQRDWVGEVLYSARSSSQRGVVILIWKNLNIKILKQQLDEEARWLALNGELFGIKHGFMNICTPTADLPGFFVEVRNEITQFGKSYAISGRDFNNVRTLGLIKKLYIGYYLTLTSMKSHECVAGHRMKSSQSRATHLFLELEIYPKTVIRHSRYTASCLILSARRISLSQEE